MSPKSYHISIGVDETLNTWAWDGGTNLENWTLVWKGSVLLHRNGQQKL
jgi:hypothetical protein